VALSAAVACPPPLPSAFLPLVAGLAVAQAGRDLGAKTFLKWPNDVLIGEHKWCGILVESTRAPGGGLVAVVGIGLNVSQTAEQLPVPTATSLALAGAAASRPAAAAAVLNRLGSLVTEWERGEDLLPRCRALSATLGKEVAVGLGAETVRGRAADIANDGRLGVIVDGQLRYFAAGDVEHLRAI
jgi:BirA family biotin operon repressor/biotin-[acetyl-CoA-carboxylase] ligase